MFDNLIPIAIGLVIFSLVLGVGQMVLQNMAGTQCTYPGWSYYNATDGVCTNNSAGDKALGGTNTSTPTSAATLYKMQGYVGTSSGGLATWTTAIIALVIGVLFIGAIMMLRGRKY